MKSKSIKNELCFQNLTENYGANTARGYLNNLVSEFARLRRLLPEQWHNVEEIRLSKITPPKRPLITFQHAFGQLEKVQTTRSIIEELEDQLINHPETNALSKGTVLALHQAHEKYCSLMNHLHVLIGEYNCTVVNAEYIELGYSKSKAEFLKPIYTYQDKYSYALATMGAILSDFYSHESNHPIKPSLVIDYIEALYNENAPQDLQKDYDNDESIFPKDRKSKFFNDVIFMSLLDVPNHKNWSGRTKEEYKQIDKKLFYVTYSKYCFYPD
jgi:hypothetical protein